MFFKRNFFRERGLHFKDALLPLRFCAVFCRCCGRKNKLRFRRVQVDEEKRSNRGGGCGGNAKKKNKKNINKHGRTQNDFFAQKYDFNITSIFPPKSQFCLKHPIPPEDKWRVPITVELKW